jgi:hypothetical protein
LAWLIDLSFALGQPAHLLAQMPLQYMRAYWTYTEQHGLPHWREEMQLARLNMSVDALRLPVEALSLDQYIIRPKREQSDAPEQPAAPPTEEEADAICAALGIKV